MQAACDYEPAAPPHMDAALILSPDQLLGRIQEMETRFDNWLGRIQEMEPRLGSWLGRIVHSGRIEDTGINRDLST